MSARRHTTEALADAVAMIVRTRPERTVAAVKPPRHPDCTHAELPLGACSRCASYGVLVRRMYTPA